VLSGITLPDDARVLVDFRTADDAGVYALDERTALVQTVDFFTPIVDDPYDFGAIAAANALSDVYAMGGTPLTALAIAALPRRGFPAEDVQAIFRGGFEALRAAGVALLGGHTVQDDEVKFGYAVTGTVAPGAQWANAGARAGDVLVLTKPLGTGVISTAIKHEQASAGVVAAAVASMRALNGPAARVLREAGGDAVHGCTDVTGFGLAGHASEMAVASGVRVTLFAARLPALPGVEALAPKYQPGGAATNEAHLARRIEVGEAVPALARVLLYDPQTSGGLLASVGRAAVPGVMRALAAEGIGAWIVGEADVQPAGDPVVISVVPDASAGEL
jgi:selenide,water dikinase